tara:strand:+ start:79 stop:1245 length:1167 start_codon:yes stop_codon:yes gene_type:complete
MDFDSEYGSFLKVSTYFKDKSYYEYYWKFLILIGVFYILPSLQFVFFQSHDPNAICYYNNKCKRDFFFIPAFNNVVSNILYIVFGLLYIIIIKFNKSEYNEISSSINYNSSIYYSLGILLVFEGICSSIYHICPSILNFQFDTTFMFLGTILMFITIYQKRHLPPSPMKVYSFSALLIFINTLPLSGLSNGLEIWFWGAFFLLMSYLMVFGSIYLYYDEIYDLDVSSFKKFYNKIKSLKKHDLPKFVLVVSLNTFTLGMFIYATINKPNFTDWLLGVCIINLIIYYMYYIFQKIKCKEPISKLLWTWMVIDIILMGLALIYFFKGVSDKFLSKEESDLLNEPCVLFNYFDYHDIWHLLSALGLFIFMNIIFFIDKNLNSHLIEELPIF